MNRRISVVIPALGEGEHLALLVHSLQMASGVEVIAAIPDGDEATAAIAAHGGARVVRGVAGRGQQLIAGAAAATGDILLFCHADTMLPAGWDAAVRAALATPGVVGGAFRLRIGAAGAAYRVIEKMANLRTRVARVPYGDQAYFTTREIYDATGGFAPIPLMEDVEYIWRLRRRGRLALLDGEAVSSARRWESEGPFYGTVRNWTLMTCYLLGVSPVTLAGFYRR